MATIYEVSKLAGVSLATVSRVMNNNAMSVMQHVKKSLPQWMNLAIDLTQLLSHWHQIARTVLAYWSLNYRVRFTGL